MAEIMLVSQDTLFQLPPKSLFPEKPKDWEQLSALEKLRNLDILGSTNCHFNLATIRSFKNLQTFTFGESHRYDLNGDTDQIVNNLRIFDIH